MLSLARRLIPGLFGVPQVALGLRLSEVIRSLVFLGVPFAGPCVPFASPLGCVPFFGGSFGWCSGGLSW
jgi:hypothetical protein